MPESSLVVDNVVAGALAPLPTGGFVYGERLTGDVWRAVPRKAGTAEDPADVESKDDTELTKLAHLDIAKGGGRGVLGLAVDKNGRIYTSFTDAADRLVVAEITGDTTRTIWVGPPAAPNNLGGRLALSPLNRLTLSIGDLDEPAKINDPDAPNGKIVTLDPERGPDQRPNVISKGWTDPQGLAYDLSGSLWVADGDRLARATEAGTADSDTDLGQAVGASGLTFFGDKELVVCQRANKRLTRWLIVNGTQLSPGRTVAKNCSYDVIEQASGSLAYATDSTIRIIPD